MDQNINKPIVSVILPVYNGAKYLAKAIESVLNQSFSNFELVIINDGSTDESLKIMRSFSDSRIKIIDQENKGFSDTLNTGIENAKAEYIARIDADDVWTDQNKLGKQVEFMKKNPSCVIVGTWATVINENGEELSRLTYPESDANIRSKMLIKCCFIHSSVVFSKAACLKAGKYNKQEKCVEDYGLWLRMGQFGTFANLPEYSLSYRIHSENMTQSNNLIQSKYSLMVAKKYKAHYPNFLLGYLKWNLKLFLLKTIGLKNINRLKR